LISPVKTVPAAVIKEAQYQVPAVPVTSRQLFAAGTAAGTIEFSYPFRGGDREKNS